MMAKETGNEIAETLRAFARERIADMVQNVDLVASWPLAKYEANLFELKAYDDTTADECAAWLHAADLSKQLAASLERILVARKAA